LSDGGAHERGAVAALHRRHLEIAIGQVDDMASRAASIVGRCIRVRYASE
jgi:hypothetical protein